MANKGGNSTSRSNAAGNLSNLFKNKGDWVRDIASSFFSDALSLAGREVILNAMRDRAKPTDDDLDSAHRKLPEADQSVIMGMMNKIVEFAEAINASADPKDVKERKIEEFKKLLLADLKSKKEDKPGEPKRTKDFNEVLDSLDEETGQRFVFWFSLLDPAKQVMFNNRKNDVTAPLLKRALSRFVLADQRDRPEIGRFADVLTSLEPGQLAKYQALLDHFTPDQEKALTDVGDRIPKKVFLAAIDRVEVGKKREAEDFCVFRTSLEISLGDRYDLFESKLPVAERGRLNAIRTWLTKESLKTWLPTAKECSPETSVASLEQFELYVTERKAAAVVAFGPTEATRILRFVLASLNPDDPSLRTLPTDPSKAEADKIYDVIMGNLPPPPKPFKEQIQKAKKGLDDVLGELGLGLTLEAGPDPSKLPMLRKSESDDAYFVRIKSAVQNPGESDEDCRKRCQSAIRQKGKERDTRITNWLMSGKKIADMPEIPRS